tara:strand:+ start:141 stop:500 length:360 start_codon:yes stop_codon:yes gene_type:complete
MERLKIGEDGVEMDLIEEKEGGKGVLPVGYQIHPSLPPFPSSSTFPASHLSFRCHPWSFRLRSKMAGRIWEGIAWRKNMELVEFIELIYLLEISHPGSLNPILLKPILSIHLLHTPDDP